MDEDRAFGEWLDRYTDEKLGGQRAAHFLSSEHLQAAFEAGREAERAQADQCARVPIL